MSRLETLLEETLDTRAAGGPDGAPVADRVVALMSRERRGWAMPLAMAAAVVVVVAGAVSLTQLGNGGHGRPAHLTPSVVATPTPPRVQAVGYRGVRIQVPTTWTLNDIQCGTPASDTVLLPRFPTAIEDCLLSPSPSVAVVIMGPTSSLGLKADVRLATHHTTVNGMPALVGSSRSRHVGVLGLYLLSARELVHILVIPSRHVVITEQSPGDRAGDAVLQSATAISR